MGVWRWWVQLRQVFSHHSRCSAHSHPLLGNYFVLLVISRASHQSGVYIFKFRRYTPTKAMTRCAHVPYAPTFISKCRRRDFKLSPTTGQCGRSYRCAKHFQEPSLQHLLSGSSKSRCAGHMLTSHHRFGGCISPKFENVYARPVAGL